MDTENEHNLRVREIVDETSGTRYIPWTDQYAVGYRAEHADGRVEFIYFNPSGGSDDGVPTVFVYIGADGDPTKDAAQIHFGLVEDVVT